MTGDDELLVERMAIMEYDGGLPRSWAESLARLCAAPKPGAYTEERWTIIVEDACRLMAHLPAILRNGWTPEDIRGLLPHIKGRPVVGIGMGEVKVWMAGRAVPIYRRPTVDGKATWTEGRRG